jgi:hypothetical protein
MIEKMLVTIQREGEVSPLAPDLRSSATPLS